MRRYALLAAALLFTNVTCSRQEEKHSSITTAPEATSAGEENFVPLFDGQSLAGWQGRVEDYEVADGVLICKKGAHGNLYTDREYSDFILRLEYRLEAGGNNGIGIRAALGDSPPAVTGIEIQILDDSFPEYQSLKPVQFNGSVYGAAPAKRGHTKPVGQWDAMEIIAKDSRIQVVLNGTRIVDVDMDTVGPVRMHNLDFVGLHNKNGYIAICGHNIFAAISGQVPD